jgi:hypothetical protein
MDFRPAGETFDRLFLATKRHKYCVLGFDTEKCCLVTHAKGNPRDKLVGWLLLTASNPKIPATRSYYCCSRYEPINPDSLSLCASFFRCFQPCWFFLMPLPSFCFVGALYVAWVLFYVGLFSVRTFFFSFGGADKNWDDQK